MSKSLLEKARKNLPARRRVYSADDMRLAILWAKGEIGITEVGRTVSLGPSGTITFLAYTMREAMKTGRIISTIKG